ncbi:MAG: hypothetical protein KY440_10630 [Actinobacteria bacterium]|nr:hypothetical protein [Actinomycetota bacterium]
MTLAFAAAAADFVLEHGPLTIDQMHALALERGVTKARTPASLKQSLGRRFVLRPDGRYDTAARLLAGQAFTTRLRRPPIDGVLWSHRDLDPFTTLDTSGGLPLVSGGVVRPGTSGAAAWTGPAGWLSERAAGDVLVLRWDGRQLGVELAVDVPAGDSATAQDVRRLLARHARLHHHHEPWRHAEAMPLTAVVLSALIEDPTLFVHPLPPLSELVPLPEDLRPQDQWSDATSFSPCTVVQVPLPDRVHRELARRSDLLGEQLPQYMSMLLSAAADRILPPARGYGSYPPSDAYDDSGDVIQLSRWSR